MSDLLEVAELHDVEMDHLAGIGALVAAGRLGRLERLRGVEAQAAEALDIPEEAVNPLNWDELTLERKKRLLHEASAARRPVSRCA